MASPNYDSLSIQHSRNIGDKVAAAATDGVVWSSTQRDSQLNAAIKTWMAQRAGMALTLESRGMRADSQWNALNGYINEASASLTANAVAFTAYTPNVWLPLSAYNATSNVPILPYPFSRTRYFTGTGGNQFLTASATQQYYVLTTGSLKVLGSGATDSVTLRFVAVHTALSAGGASDIVIGSQFWQEILNIAAAIANEDEPTQERVARAQFKYGQAEKLMAL